MQENTKEWEEKLHKQKAHYESGMERHLKLVDRLLGEKAELTKRCELFTEELKAVEKRFQMKMEEQDERASRELSRNKQNWIAAEKLRRESWEKDKVREIKEITIKGLQPEVERILLERKQEKKSLDDSHREAMENQRKELLEFAQTQVREARENFIKEHERALDHEREAHRRKLREEFERFNADLLAERSRCASDLLVERRLREQDQHQGKEAAETRLREAVSVAEATAAAALEEARASSRAVEEAHRAEVATMKSEHQAEMERERSTLRQDGEERARAELLRREAQLRDDFAKERDRQLSVLMEKLSREHVEQQRAVKEASDVLVQQVRAEAEEASRGMAVLLEDAKAETVKFEARCKLHEETVQSLRDRHDTEQSRIVELEERIRVAGVEKEALQKSLDGALGRQQEEGSRAMQLKEKELEVMRGEMRLLALRSEEAREREERLKTEAERRQGEVIGELETRVKRTLQGKDETIQELRTRCSVAESKAREFEQLLARQREELLGDLTRTRPV